MHIIIYSYNNSLVLLLVTIYFTLRTVTWQSYAHTGAEFVKSSFEIFTCIQLSQIEESDVI